ncbi:MAG: hypothetical protein ACREE4_18455 [Stellaceae bacterium]
MGVLDAAPSPGARRVRLCRERRRHGCFCVTVELHESEMEKLVRFGLLSPAERGDRHAVRAALHGLFDEAFRAR